MSEPTHFLPEDTERCGMRTMATAMAKRLARHSRVCHWQISRCRSESGLGAARPNYSPDHDGIVNPIDGRLRPGLGGMTYFILCHRDFSGVSGFRVTVGVVGQVNLLRTRPWSLGTES
jgi:hypothetical protein